MATTLELQAILRERGFETIGSACCGLYRGYAIEFRPYSPEGFSMGTRYRDRMGSFTMAVAVRLDEADRSATGELVRALSGTGLRQLLRAFCSGRSLRLDLYFGALDEPFERQVGRVLEYVTDTLRARGAAPADTCAVCGGAKPECLAHYEGYQPVHAACARELVRSARKNAENDRVRGSYLAGLAGAVLGAVVGMLPSLLTVIFLDAFYLLLGLLIPLASMWGYRKFGGRNNGVGIAIVILLSFFSVPLLHTLSVAMAAVEAFELPFRQALILVLDYASSAEGFFQLLGESLPTQMGMALCVWAAWAYLGRSSSRSVRDAEAVVASLRPDPDRVTADPKDIR